MNRVRSLGVLLLCVVVASTLCAAIDVAEVGVELQVTHDPFLSDGRFRLSVGLGAYCKLSVTDEWMLRAEFGSPLEIWLPWAGLATSHTLGDRWILEARLAAQSDLLDSVYLTLNAGGRVLVAGSGRSRLMLSSFPVSLAGLFFFTSSDWSFLPAVALNVFLDYSWAASEKMILGQTIGFSVAELRGFGSPMALPIGEFYGLILQSVTHAGYRP